MVLLHLHAKALQGQTGIMSFEYNRLLALYIQSCSLIDLNIYSTEHVLRAESSELQKIQRIGKNLVTIIH